MTTFHDVPADLVLPVVAGRLTEMPAITPPVWASYVKTGVHRERVPDQDDWWHVRAAAMLRKIALNGPIGVTGLAGLYGGPRDRNAMPNKARRGSRHIARTVVQQLEDAGLVVEKRSDGGEIGFGRMVTGAGHALLDAAAHTVRDAAEAAAPGLSRY